MTAAWEKTPQPGTVAVATEDDNVTEERQAFLDAMSRAVTGVTVVTSDGQYGRRGQTVSAMCSVSADPPSLLVCLNRKSLLVPAIEGNRVFSVNVLRADQKRISDSFAGRPAAHDEAYDFERVRWETAVTGSPMLSSAVAKFDCQLLEAHTIGTHTIFIGEVVASSAAKGKPLVYASRGYGEIFAFPRSHTAPFTVADIDPRIPVDLGEF
jgi:flavin reductase (DIM6/NTAB) family NADH-FMN oxidoreductase RutF